MPRHVTSGAIPLRTLDPVWIPLSDGCRLAATVWLPADAERAPVPALLEYLPYRRRDGTALRDSQIHPWFAARGYAAVRVDMRGTGDSDGLMLDEYLQQEQDDAVEVIAWLAAQPWCSGQVGMFGISWGGFNALQVAARRPPALKAVITLCSTDDRYGDDTHYMGGCLLTGNLGWGSTMLALSSRPPDPAIVGERWRRMWMERLENIPLYVAHWTRHQTRDAYWRHGSVCEDFAAITCAVYAVGGWADAYTNAIPRLLEGLSCPRKGLVGPWAHAWPQSAKPGPTIGFLHEAARWWDYWLKGRDTGVMDGPMLQVWLQESMPPATYYECWPGAWIGEPSWPSPHMTAERWPMSVDGRLDRDYPAGGVCMVASQQTVGAASGAWCPYGLEGDFPGDQREEDAGSVVFDGPVLTEPLPILGSPVLELVFACDRPQAFLAARLCDVAPDGASTRVSYGLLNLTHRDGHEAPQPLVPGERYRARLRLNDLGHRFAAGHRFRLALSTAYWPMVWPAQAAARVTVFAGESALVLPTRRRSADGQAIAPFLPAEQVAAMPHELLRPPSRSRSATREPDTGVLAVTAHKDRGAMHLPGIGLVTDLKGLETFWIDPGDPLSAVAETAWDYKARRGSWEVGTATRTRFSGDAKAFRIEASLQAFEGATRIYARSWDERIPRRDV